MRFSIYANIADAPRMIDSTWGDLVDSIRNHVITDRKDSVYLFSPAAFPPGAPHEDCYVDSVAFGVIDYDHLSEAAVQSLFQFLGTLPFPWCIYSSHSHGKLADGSSSNPVGTPESAFRLLFPFLSPVPGKEWESFWPRMASLFVTPDGKVKPDPKCKNPSRFYYVPSAHPDRAQYKYFYEHNPPGASPFDPSALRTDILVRNVVSGETVKPQVRGGGFANVTRPMLEALASRLKRKKLQTGEALIKVLDGLPWAENGSRDNVLYQLAGDIASEFPKADMRSLAEFFALSVNSIGDPEYSLDTVVAKLLRRQQEIQAEELQKEADARAERAYRIRSAYREFKQEREEPYSEAELQTFANVAGVSAPEFKRRWIVQSGGSFYFFFAGTYIGPVSEADSTLAARKYLAPAPVDLDAKNQFGITNPRSIQSLASEYGTHARFVIADMNNEATWFDAGTSTMIEAPCPLRRLNARFDPVIDGWLQVMAGDKYALVCDWLSWVTDLDRPCAALYLQGPPGTGKSLLAKGVARLYVDGPPTTLVQAFGNFNEGLMRCPVVFADETLPKDQKGNAKTAELREFIQQEARPLSRKFRSDAVLKGATRVIIAANNKNLLQTHEQLTTYDIQAIADRIVHIPVSVESAHYLEARSSEVKYWNQEGDRLAEHILWIVQNRKKNPNPPRFLVKADKSELHVDIAFGTTLGAGVAHWLVQWLSDPARLWAGKTPTSTAYRITYNTGAGVIVSAQCLADNWSTYKTNIREDRAPLRSIGLALGGIGYRKGEYTFPGGRISQVHFIELDSLCVWGEENGIHPQEIRENAARLAATLQQSTVRSN